MGRMNRWWLAVAFANSVAVAQEEIHSVTGSSPGDSLILGAALGDVDGDGFDDFAVAARHDGGGNGAAWIHSGQTGNVLFPLSGTFPGEQFGFSLVALNDTDGDGIRDLLVGAPYSAAGGGPAGQLYLISGATGKQRLTIGGTMPDTLGFNLAPAGDIDNDGFGDFLSIHVNHLDAYSGGTGSVVQSIAISGVTRAVGIPDLNGDGHDDILCGFPQESGPAGEQFMGWVRAYSGKDGSQLFQQNGEAAFDQFGGLVDVIGDLDGDNLADYLVSAEQADGLAMNSGVAYIFSSANQTLIHRFDGPTTGSRFGALSSAAGDANGDGFGDVLVAAHPNLTTIYLYSGRTGNLLYQFDPVTFCCGEIAAIGPAGDVNRDGFDDFFRGSMVFYQVGQFEPGTVQVLGGNDLWLQGTGALVPVGSSFDMTTREGTPGGPSLVATVAIDGVPMFQSIGGLLPLDASGTRVDQGTVPPVLAGVQMSFQSFGQGPTGINGASAVLTVFFF